MPSPLEALLQLNPARRPGTHKMMANDPAELYDLQGQFGRESRQNLRQAQKAGAPRGEILGLAGQTSDWQADQATTMERMMPTPEEIQMKESILSGFGSYGSGETDSGNTPLQSREIYRRKADQEKMRQPVELKRIEGEYDVRQQQAQSQGLVDQQKVIAGAKTQGYDLFNKLLQGDGLKPGQRATISGVGSINEPEFDSAPNAAFQGILKARQEYEFAQQDKGFFRDDTGPRKKALDDAVIAWLGQAPYSPVTKTTAFKIYNNPSLNSDDFKDASSQEIIMELAEQAPDLMQMDEESLMQVIEALQTMRGK